MVSLTCLIAEPRDSFLYLSDKKILSLPTLAEETCNVDLSQSDLFGVAGIVTDLDAVPRLMVCSLTGCWLRKESGWESDDTITLKETR